MEGPSVLMEFTYVRPDNGPASQAVARNYAELRPELEVENTEYGVREFRVTEYLAKILVPTQVLYRCCTAYVPWSNRFSTW